MCLCWFFFFFKHKTAYEMRISDWSSDVCSSDLGEIPIRASQDIKSIRSPLRLSVHVFRYTSNCAAASIHATPAGRAGQAIGYLSTTNKEMPTRSQIGRAHV